MADQTENTQGSNNFNFLASITISKVVIAFWVLFSVPFVAFQAWAALETNFYERGLQEGATRAADAAYGDLINKASNPQCNAVFVTQGERRIELINKQCLKIVQPAKPVAQAQGEAPKAKAKK